MDAAVELELLPYLRVVTQFASLIHESIGVGRNVVTFGKVKNIRIQFGSMVGRKCEVRDGRRLEQETFLSRCFNEQRS